MTVAELEEQIRGGCMPGRVILKFPDPEKDDRGFVLDKGSGLALPRAKRQENQAVVVAVGPPIDEFDTTFSKIVQPGDDVFAYPGYGKSFIVNNNGETLTYYVYMSTEIFYRFPREHGNR